jgi:hypothetical protein
VIEGVAVAVGVLRGLYSAALSPTSYKDKVAPFHTLTLNCSNCIPNYPIHTYLFLARPVISFSVFRFI